MKFVLCGLVLLATTVAAARPKLNHNLPRLDTHEKRADDTSFTLYAYGGSTEENAVGGLPIIYSDGNNVSLYIRGSR